MKLFIGQGEYGSVFIFKEKNQYGFGDNPMFTYRGHLPLGCTIEDALDRKKHLKKTYPLLHLSDYCAGPLVKEVKI